MHMAVARDVARPAGPGADRSQRLLDRRQYRRVLAHAALAVRAPPRDLGGDAMAVGARKPAAAPLEIGKYTVPPSAQLEGALEIQASSSAAEPQ